jgi:replication factor A2
MFGGAFAEDAQQFNGGGFMPSPGAQEAQDTGAKKSYDSQSQSVRRLTIRQLASGLGQGDGITVDGKEVSNIALVGKASNVKEDAVTFNLTLDDGTGKIAVKMFISNDQNEDLEAKQRTEVVDGIYVRVFGHVHHYQNETQISAFSIRPITDHNEITYHLSQVIFQHLHFTKGSAGQTAGSAPVAAKIETAHHQNSGMAPVDGEILTIFNTSDTGSDAGMTVADVISISGGRLDHSTVLSAINRLVDQGHLYSTIDDAHWKSCNF